MATLKSKIWLYLYSSGPACTPLLSVTAWECGGPEYVFLETREVSYELVGDFDQFTGQFVANLCKEQQRLRVEAASDCAIVQEKIEKYLSLGYTRPVTDDTIPF